MAITKEQLEAQIKSSAQKYYEDFAKTSLGNTSIEDFTKRAVFFKVDPRTVETGEVKSLEDFYNSLRAMPLKDAEKALNKFSQEDEQNNIVICGFSKTVDYLNVMKDSRLRNAFSINEIEKANEACAERNWNPTLQDPKPLNWFQQIWNNICEAIWSEPSTAMKEYSRKSSAATTQGYLTSSLSHDEKTSARARYGLDANVIDSIMSIYKEKGLPTAAFDKSPDNTKSNAKETAKLNNEPEFGNVSVQLSSNDKNDIYKNSTPEQRYKSLFSKNQEITAFAKKGYTINPDLFKDSANLSFYTDNSGYADPGIDEAIRLLCTAAVNSPKDHARSYGNTSGELMNQRFSLPYDLTHGENALKAALTVDIIMDDLLGGKESSESRTLASAILNDGKSYYNAGVKNKEVLLEGILTGMSNLCASLSTTPPEDFLNPTGVATLKLQCLQRGFEYLEESGIANDDKLTLPLKQSQLNGMAPWLLIADRFDRSHIAQKKLTRKNNVDINPEEAFKDIMLEASLRATLYENAKTFREKVADPNSRDFSKISGEVLSKYPILTRADNIVNNKDGNSFYTDYPATSFLAKTITPENLDKLKRNVASEKVCKSVDSIDKLKAMTTLVLQQSHTIDMISALEMSANKENQVHQSASNEKKSVKIKEKSGSGYSM